MADGNHTILAIGAHVGDMELTCGGMLASQALQGDRIITLALTAGEKGNPPDMDVAAYRARKVQEALRFAEALGGQSIVLDHPDGLLACDEQTVWEVCDCIRECRPDIIVTHWRESVHKDHFNTQRIVADARYFAANSGFVRKLPAYPCRHVYFAENWEDSRDFRPFLYVDISAGYELWRKEIGRMWFAVHSRDFRYAEYYDALSICRGCESGKPRAEAFAVRDTHDRMTANSIWER